MSAGTIFKLKQNSIGGQKPDPADLEIGELAMNVADKKMYSKDVGGNIFQVNSAATGTLSHDDAIAYALVFGG